MITHKLPLFVSSLLLQGMLSSMAVMPALAEDSAGMRIATVDINRIMNDLGEAKNAKKTLDALSADMKQKLEQKKKKLETLEKKIREQKLGDKSDEMAQYRKGAQEFQAAAGEAKEELNKQFMKVNKSISEKVIQAVEAYAKEQKIDLVLDKSARVGNPVLFGDSSADITEEISKKLSQ